MKRDLENEQIELRLKQAPKMHDTRSKDEVFKRLQEDGVFLEVQKQMVGPQKKFHWKSLLASIASIFLLVLIASNFIGTTPEMMTEDAADESAESVTSGGGEESAPFSENNMEMARTFMMPQRSALYADQVGNNTVFTIGLAGDDAESVPVSILIPKEQVQQVFNEQQPTMLELYTHYAPLMDEEAIGFNEYHPLLGKLTENDGTLTHHLPQEQSYDEASASMSNYIGVLVDTFQRDYKKVEFVTEAGEPFEFSQAGVQAEPLQLTGVQTQYNYFLYTMRNGSQYISPNFRMSYEDVETALQSMLTESNDIYQTLILPNVSYRAEVDGDVVTITFDELLDLDAQDVQAAMRMIEGMLLTAANFDKTVNFKNVLQEQWYDFDFTQPMPMPIAPNLIDYSVIFG